MSNETVREATSGQIKDLASTAIGGIPNDLSFDAAKKNIGDKKSLIDGIQNLFLQLISPSITISIDPDAPVCDIAKEKNWKLISDMTYQKGDITLESAEILESGEDYIKGDSLVERARTLSAGLGYRHAEVLLEKQDSIPQEWRRYYFVFTETVWEDSGGYRRVAVGSSVM